MLLERLRTQTNLTPLERDVADYILAHLDEVAQLSASGLGKASYTSKATVVRLSQKLGLSGYPELKLQLVAELNQRQRLDQLLASEPITSQSSYEDILQTLPALYDKAMTNTRFSLKQDGITRLIHKLQHASAIHLYGVGISYAAAQAAAFKWSTLGLECTAFESLNAHYIAARQQRATVVVLISFTGGNALIQSIAQHLRQHTPYYIVGVLGPHHEAVAPWCHEVIEVPNRDSLVSLDVLSSFAAVNYVVDVIFSLLLANRYEAHVQSSLKMLDQQVQKD